VTQHDTDAPWCAVQADTILEVLVHSRRQAPEQPALIFEDGLYVSRGELVEAVERFAGYLANHIDPGDRVAIMLGNRTEYMVAWLAVVACRATLVSLNPAAQEYDAGHILRDSGARIAVTDDENRDLLERLQPGCPDLHQVLVLAGAEPGGLAGYHADTPTLESCAAAADRRDITNIYYTSGTTGPPKGCMVDHEYWLRFVDLFQRRYGLGADDRLLCCLQFFYNDPPWQLLLSLHAGTPLVVMRRFSVRRHWEVASANRVTVIFGIASTASLLLKAETSQHDRDHQVRFALQVGIPTNLHRDLVDRWGFPWLEGYGLTETGLLTSMPLDQAEKMIGSGSIGLPCPEVKLRIVDDAGRDIPTGTVGEIVVRAPGLMRGYLNQPEETAKTLRHGWLHTGDVGSTNEDGFVYFHGRQKDIIRRGGENVAAAEVEQVLRGHPAVLEAAVIPVADELRGEEIKAFVVADADAVPPQDLVAFCADRLAKYKIPRYFTYRDTDLPRTPSMRVKKDTLRANEADIGADTWDRQHSLGW